MKKQLICATVCAITSVFSISKPTMAQITATIISGPRGKALGPKAKAEWLKACQLDKEGVRALDAHEYAQAELCARQALALGQLFSRDTLAQALYRQGKTDEAFQEYKALAKPGFGYPGRELPLALLLLKRGDWADAVKFYNGALWRLGQGALVRDNSHFTVDTVQTKELEAAIHVAMGLNFNTEESRVGASRDDLALDEYHQALTLQPDSPLANYYYGYGVQKLAETQKLMEQRQQKELLKAQEAFEKAALLGKGDVKLAAQKALNDQKAHKAAKPKNT